MQWEDHDIFAAPLVTAGVGNPAPCDGFSVRNNFVDQ